MVAIASAIKSRILMAAQTGEASAVANRAGLQILYCVLRGVTIEPVFSVRGGLQLRRFDVAFAAGKRRIDPVVTDETVRHLREIGVADFVRCGESAMARGARIRRVQLGPLNCARLAEVRSRIDRLAYNGSDVRELGVNCVVEFGHTKLAGSFNLLRVLMTSCADSWLREKIILRLRALHGGRVTHVAGELLLQVDAM